jgi:polyhydroxyalkanoate synthesis regulator phasin
MAAQKQEPAAGKSSPLLPSEKEKRKPWVKKTPTEIVLGEADKLRKHIAEREEELKALRKQLEKFEEARKIFEST